MAPPPRFESPGAWYVALVLGGWMVLALQSVLVLLPGPRFDVVPALTVHLAAELDLVAGLVLCSLVGFGADVLSGEVRGLVSSSQILTFVVLRLMVRGVRTMRPALMVTMGLAAVGVTVASQVVLRSFAQGEIVGIAQAVVTYAPAVLAVLPLHWLLTWVGRPFRPREESGFRK